MIFLQTGKDHNTKNGIVYELNSALTPCAICDLYQKFLKDNKYSTPGPETSHVFIQKIMGTIRDETELACGDDVYTQIENILHKNCRQVCKMTPSSAKLNMFKSAEYKIDINGYLVDYKYPVKVMNKQFYILHEEVQKLGLEIPVSKHYFAVLPDNTKCNVSRLFV